MPMERSIQKMIRLDSGNALIIMDVCVWRFWNVSLESLLIELNCKINYIMKTFEIG